ncbi:hypothetical protein HOY82DRAFT_260503 [Tuber indicum]|nr:hypothetical protein HOY82DRAFT_260503 [Tuber indicum]
MEVVMMIGYKHGYLNSCHRLPQEHRNGEATAKGTGRRLTRLLPTSLLLVFVSIFYFPLIALTDFMLRGHISMGQFLANLNLRKSSEGFFLPCFFLADPRGFGDYPRLCMLHPRLVGILSAGVVVALVKNLIYQFRNIYFRYC